MENKVLPLAGLKVVDLSTIVAAPTAAELLCMFGADVVKVEAFNVDGQREMDPASNFAGSDKCNPMYTLQNSNKRHITLNLKSEEGIAAMYKLLADADIFVSNVRGQGLKRLGLDYETVSEKFPKIIFAHFSGYGQKGPNALDPGFDSTVFWLRGGMVADWQTDDARYPFNPTYAFGDTVTASSFFSAILMAIIGREKTGMGTKVESSLYSSAIWTNGQGVVQTQGGMKKLNPDPDKKANPQNGYYMCADGQWFSLNEKNSYASDREPIARTLGLEDILDDPRYATKETLLESGAWLEYKERITAAFLTKTAPEWKKLFQVANMPCDVAVRTASVATDEQAIVNDYLEELVYPDGTKIMMPVPPMFLSNFGRRKWTPAQTPGACTDEVLAEIGYSAEEIAVLKEKGIAK